jgi:hypothetical protein
MNHHEYNRELKRMDVHEILIHLIHICVHVEKSRHLIFLSWLVWRGGTNSHSLPLENLKVSTRNVFIHMVPHSRCVDIVMLYKVHTGDVRDLFQFKFFDKATFNPCLIVNHRSKVLQCPFNVIHPPICYCGPPSLASYGRCTSKCCIGLNHPGGNIFSNLHISTGISFSNFSIISFLISLAQSYL